MERKVYFWEQNKNFLFFSGGLKMRIAICDIDKAFLSHLKKIVYRYAELNRLDIVADCYLSGESVLDRSTYYNIIFLGYELVGMNGLETAVKLRENKINSSIIFISDYTDFVFDAFKVEAFRFLPKASDETELFAVLDDFFGKLGHDYPLWIKSEDDVVCLNTGDIYYVEADNKHCRIHLKDEVLSCNRTMARVYNVLPQNHFSKTNRAFVVNLNHISRYNNEFIVLKNGETLHPSRNYYKSFKEEYRRFLKPYEV